jgi:hypothetical protein
MTRRCIAQYCDWRIVLCLLCSIVAKDFGGFFESSRCIHDLETLMFCLRLRDIDKDQAKFYLQQEKSSGRSHHAPTNIIGSGHRGKKFGAQ